MVRSLRPFEYVEPATIGEAVQVLSGYGTRAKVLAGGLDLIIRMRKREVEPECLVCLRRIPGLGNIEGSGATGLRIGALTTLRSIELSTVIREHYPVLCEAVSSIASIQVKNMGTALGNLCVGTPASDVAPALVVLGAELRVVGPASEKVIPLEDLCAGVNQTILRPDEIVAEISVPPLPAATGGAFLKLARTADDIAKINVAVLITMEADTCGDVRIALGAVAPTVMRARRAEEALRGQVPDQETIARVAETAAEEVRPIGDIRSTAEYRREMAGVLVRRAIGRALERIKR